MLFFDKSFRAGGRAGSRYPFLTQKERDVETGLDYFGARYYASIQGRFTSSDPLLASGRSTQPQSWNRYSYCINHPLKYVDPNGLIWGTQDFEQNGRKYRRYRWFDGDKVGKGFTAFTPAKDGTDISLKGGGSARIWADGRRQYFPGAPPIVISGQDNLNLTVGLAHGAVSGFTAGSPIGQAAVNWIFNQVGGVEHDSALYQNGHLIGEGTVVGSLALAALGMGGHSVREAAAEETTTLYRAVGNAEFEQIMETGTFKAGPNSLGGKWFAETLEHAQQWGEQLEGKGAFKIVDARIPTVQANQLMRLGRLDGIGPARYAELKQLEGAVIGKVP